MKNTVSSRIIRGRLACHPKGFGFVIPSEPSPEGDVFIPKRRMQDAVHGDEVEVRILPPRPWRGKRGKERPGPEGEIVRILNRASHPIVGKLFRYRRETLVAPVDERYHYTVRLPDAEAEGIADGTIVVVEITEPPRGRELAQGVLKEVLGEAGDPEIQYRIICHNHDIPMEFPAAVLEEAEAAEPPLESAIETSGRSDFRNWGIVTIDGETARDFDDAVNVEKLEDGTFRLGVHIADVSYYVRPETLLDDEALRRGTSVYFPDRAIPMLPERLSNDLCSLKPGVDRLTLSVVMRLDRSGAVLERQFAESVIRSRERMTYDQVKQIVIDREPELLQRFGPLVERFDWMLELSRILQARRARRGAIDFDLPEAEVEYDVNGEVHDIVRAERNEAHRIIEEFMLLANETVLRYLMEQDIPSIHRIHEPPDPFKVEEFLEVASKFGYRMEPGPDGEYRPHDFQQLARQLSGRKEERFLSYLMLRSFKLARYSHLHIGHFGLAASHYTHFTSPIRRYPDLIVHRLLRGALSGQKKTTVMEQLYARLPEIADQSSDRERKAVEAERAVMRWIMAEFMADRLGDEFEAFIIGVKENGFFVELLEHYVEGFVPVATLWDDYYVFNARHHCLIGENDRQVFRIGDTVRVRVDKVSPDRHLIDFSVVLSEDPKAQKGSRKRRR